MNGSATHNTAPKPFMMFFMCGLLSCGFQLAANRQLPQPLAGGRVNRVGQCGRERRCTWFADPAACLATFDDMHVDWRRLVDAQHPVVREVVLLDAAVLDRDRVARRRYASDR